MSVFGFAAAYASAVFNDVIGKKFFQLIRSAGVVFISNLIILMQAEKSAEGCSESTAQNKATLSIL